MTTRKRDNRSPCLDAGRRLATATGLIVGALLAVAAAAAAAPVTFGSGHLEWGVKESFRNYVVGAGEYSGGGAGGSYTATDGAIKLAPSTPSGNGRIQFDVLGGPYDDETGLGELLIDGTVHFTGHGGSLDLTIKNIRLVLAGSTGTLYADITDRDLETGTISHCVGVPLGGLEQVESPVDIGGDPGGLTWDSIPVTLSQAGAPAFGGFYTAGAAMDPLAPLVAELGAPRVRPDRGEGGGEVNCGGDVGGDGGGIDGGGIGGGGSGGGNVPIALPKIIGLIRPVTLGASRVARIATLRCGGASCTVKTPKAVKIKIKSKRYRVAVLAPKSLKVGRSGKLRVKLSKAARKALVGRRTIVKVKVTLTADGRKTTKTIRATLKAKKAKRVKSRR